MKYIKHLKTKIQTYLTLTLLPLLPLPALSQTQTQQKIPPDFEQFIKTKEKKFDMQISIQAQLETGSSIYFVTLEKLDESAQNGLYHLNTFTNSIREIGVTENIDSLIESSLPQHLAENLILNLVKNDIQNSSFEKFKKSVNQFLNEHGEEAPNILSKSRLKAYISLGILNLPNQNLHPKKPNPTPQTKIPPQQKPYNPLSP